MATKKLSPQQYAAIEYLTAFSVGDRLTYQEIADKVNVDQSTLRRWRTKDDAFINEMIRQTKRNAVADLPKVMAALPELIVKGENAAMLRTWLQTINALTDKVEITSNTSSADVDDIKAQIADMKRKIGGGDSAEEA